MLSPSTLPFSSECVCVCQHEPKLLFYGKQRWKWGLKTQLCSQPGPGAPCWLAPGHGKWEQALVWAWLCNDTQPLQEPFAKAAATATAWLPNPPFLWGLQLWTPLCSPHGCCFSQAILPLSGSHFSADLWPCFG